VIGPVAKSAHRPTRYGARDGSRNPEDHSDGDRGTIQADRTRRWRGASVSRRRSPRTARPGRPSRPMPVSCQRHPGDRRFAAQGL
jgi:hypothetical protein